MIEAHGKSNLERGWQKKIGKGLAEKVGERLAKRLAKGWLRVSLNPRTLQFPKCPFRKVGLSREGFSRNPRGIFPTETLGDFCGGFFGGIFEPLSLEEDKRATTNVQHRFLPFFSFSFLVFCSH